ncbi:hypothetical protein [Actinomadura parmotrematis]|uniref:HIT family protein n=1 Tax=Actinomadura parmotrematis TaxID=2864039 RepID=A0ABS7G416_9ACTN|nr:hypothetical protein [Actinomadura parmotrematis]MBW8487226.1 hypothetical protein [Actinomadura parmotrematis]
MTDTACLMCALDDAHADTRVFRDDLWAAEVVPGYDVPGWFVLRARRHAERITGLDGDELATFAGRARDLIAAVTEATGAPATYLMMFGENHAHFHVLIAARGEDVPPDLRGGAILGLRATHLDPAASLALLPAVRAAYEQVAPV